MALLDGGGYELATKLESLGIWRTWLGDALYSVFINSLSTPATWHSFLNSTSDVHLQLRVRALLFDKASFSSPNLNSSYLQLNGDDVYFTLEDAATPPLHESKVPSQRFRQDDFPETWYQKFIESYRANKPYKVSSSIQDSDKRSPTGMSNYLKLLERHKRRRIEFKEDDNGGFGSSNSENRMQSNAISVDDASDADDTVFFPETMFMMNCVPDNVVAPRSATEWKQKVDFNGVLDTLPKVVTKSSSSIMLERLGIRPEYLSEQVPGQSHSRTGSDGGKRNLGQEQAALMSKKVVARILTNVGFEGASEIPVEVLSQFMSCHISKLGRILKVLADSYRKQCSATELIKMFLQTGGHSLSSLAEHVKDTRPVLPQNTQQIQNPQSQLVSQHQNMLQHPLQVPRQMHPQMPQMRPHNLTPQQLELLRRQQASSPRGIMSMDKNRPMVEVKLENPPDLPMDDRQAQAHWWQQQQLAALHKFGHQTRQPTSMQIPQMQSPNIGAVRAQPVKVEGFQELMGGDTSLKQNADDNKLTSPSK